MALEIWNTLSGKKERFNSIRPKRVGMYSCGPTVYNFVHIGNLRSYVFADTVRRVLEWNGYKVTHVINITDVGHLVSDADTGKDKLEEGAKREQKSVKEIVEMYTKAFFADLKALNIPRQKIIFPKATENIPEQILLIKKLLEKGHAYKTSDGIYFDITTFPDYGKLGNIKNDPQSKPRIETNPEKKNPSDFALWKFSKAEDRREQEWPSPWGIGFPGWHIECSAMSMKYLGETFDVHTSGIDHIPVHHNNEIAQSESATGKTYVHFWLHNAFVSLISGEKMSKSGENFIRLKDLMERDIDPSAFRYWLLTAHYRSQVEFSFEAVEAAQTAYKKLVRSYALLPSEHPLSKIFKNFGSDKKLLKKFTEIVNHDIDTPGAIAFLWQILKDSKNTDRRSQKKIRRTIARIDEVLGLGIVSDAEALLDRILKTPSKIKELAYDREKARKNGDWGTADKLRQRIEEAGYTLEDGSDGSILMPK